MSGTITTTLSSSIAMNASTSTKIADANDLRNTIVIFNNGTGDVWIKLQAAATDNDKKGFIIIDGGTYEMRGPIYSGEICGIAVSGTPDVYVTEW